MFPVADLPFVRFVFAMCRLVSMALDREAFRVRGAACTSDGAGTGQCVRAAVAHHPRGAHAVLWPSEVVNLFCRVGACTHR